ncbi:MAG: ribonuclease P protein component [Lentimicrobiaceae bacterium]|nr:ribonuclease P protein component [Lentimicrobiaceae bacterium]
MKEKGFSKQERICKRNDFNFLLSDGESFFSYPFRCVFYGKKAEESLVRIAVSVSKKKFKLAADRNRIKRLIREAYRLEKQHLYNLLQEQPTALDMLIIYTEKKILDHKQIKNGMQILLKKCCAKCR